MIRAFVWGLAGLGVFVSGLVFAILTVGLVEGSALMPDSLAQLLAVTLVAVATWTSGVLCTRAPGRWAALAVALVPVSIWAIGYAVMETAEGHGSGLAPQVVAEMVSVSAALVGGAAYVARRAGP